MTAGPDRRGLLLAVLGCLLATALPLIALDLVWLRVDLPALAPQPASSQTFVGSEVKGDLLAPFGIFFGAAALALLPSRRVGRRLVAIALVGAGILLIAAIWIYLADGGAGAADFLTRGRRDPTASLPPPDHELFALPALLALLAGVIAVAVGTFTMIRSSQWPVMGSRYERQSASPPPPLADNPPAAIPHGLPARPASEAAMWAALDRGEDPTSLSATAPPADRTKATRDQTAS